MDTKMSHKFALLANVILASRQSTEPKTDAPAPRVPAPANTESARRVVGNPLRRVLIFIGGMAALITAAVRLMLRSVG